MASFDGMFLILVLMVLAGIVLTAIKSASSAGQEEEKDEGETTGIFMNDPWITQIGAGTPAKLEVCGEEGYGNIEDMWFHLQVDYQNKIDMIYSFIEDLTEEGTLKEEGLKEVEERFSRIEKDMNDVGGVNDWSAMESVDEGIKDMIGLLTLQIKGSPGHEADLKILQDELSAAQEAIGAEKETLTKVLIETGSADEAEIKDADPLKDLTGAYADKAAIMTSMIEETEKKAAASGHSVLRIESLKPKMRSINERIEKAATEEDLRTINIELISAATGIRLAIASYLELRNDRDMAGLQKDLIEADRRISDARLAMDGSKQ